MSLSESKSSPAEKQRCSYVDAFYDEKARRVNRRKLMSQTDSTHSKLSRYKDGTQP